MHRFITFGAVLLVAACDPLVHETFRLTPEASPTRVTVAAPDALTGIGVVAGRFGLALEQANVDSNTRNWRGAIEADGHSQLYVRATRTTGGQATVIVGQMYTNAWSARGDSLRRAIADTLRYFGAVTPLK